VLPQKLAHERRVGVMGLGVLGTDSAQALAALRFDVAGWSRSPKQIDGVACFAGLGQLGDFLARTEILVCLLPLTASTRGILNAETFARLPQDAVVINAARGGHLVEPDLLAALDQGQIAAATLDVFETEPLPLDHPFWTHPRVTVTPHVAAATHARSAAASVVAQIDRYERGLPLEHVVDIQRGY
jgi:glyoxylate/hydroxypyruvate reductase A